MKGRFPLVEEIFMAPDASWCFEAFAPRPFGFFLDSGMDPRKLGRYSFMGSDPFLVLRSRGDRVSLIRGGGEEIRRGSPFDILGELLKVYSLDDSGTDLPFTGGVVGYFSYDLAHFIERLPGRAVDDLHLPECYLAFYDAAVAFDHLENRVFLVSSFVCLIFSTSLWAFYLFAVIFSLPYGGEIPRIPLFIGKYFGTKTMATLVGLCNFVLGAGGAMGSWVAGKIFDTTQSYQGAFIAGIVAGLVSLILVLILKRKNQQQIKNEAIE